MSSKLRDIATRKGETATKPDDKSTTKKHVHYTVIVRLPFARGDFVDPPPVHWDAAKDRKLWKLISRNGVKLGNPRGGSSASASEGGAGSSEIDWDVKAAEFGVDTRFLLQQAAWLYERHLQHVKKQVGRLRTGSAAGTPQPGQTSMLGKKPVAGSRAPSALSVRSRDSPLPRVDTIIANAPQPRPSGLSRTPSTATVTQSRVADPSPKSRTLRPPSLRKQPSSNLPSPVVDEESPGPASSSSDGSSEEDNRVSRHTTAFRRTPRFAAKHTVVKKLATDGDDEDEGSQDSEEDEPTFYSTAQLDGIPEASKTASRGLDDTLKGQHAPKGKQVVKEQTAPSEKSVSQKAEPFSVPQRTSRAPPDVSQQAVQSASAARGPATESSASSLSSANAPTSAPRSSVPARCPANPLSPRHRANLARLGSPLRGEASDGTPSMGSSFSDLDADASVTQSALEEALASNLRNGGSRLSNISNAFRSRYM